jgi:hypothetical protein
VSFNSALATLTLTDMNNDKNTLVTTSPTGTADLKGCHEIQNIGATQTYQRRYLYIDVFEICDKCSLDKKTNPHAQTTSKPVATQQHIDAAVKEVAYNPPAEFEGEKEDVICTKCGAKMYLTKFPDKNGNLYYYCSDRKKCDHKYWPEKKTTPKKAPQVEPEEYVDDVPF